MNVEIIATGSTGNALVLNDCILIDCGVAYKKIAPYIKQLKLVLLSHVHGDHLNKSTVGRLAKERPTLRFAVGSFLVNDLLQAGVAARSIDVVESGKVYDYGAFKISPVELHHDVENYGFRIFMGGEKGIYMVDTGSIDDIEAKGYDLYMLENNHRKEEIEERIRQKQATGEFAYEVRAAWTHLSEEKAIEWLAINAGQNSRYVFLHQHHDETEAKK